VVDLCKSEKTMDSEGASALELQRFDSNKDLVVLPPDGAEELTQLQAVAAAVAAQ